MPRGIREISSLEGQFLLSATRFSRLNQLRCKFWFLDKGVKALKNCAQMAFSADNPGQNRCSIFPARKQGVKICVFGESLIAVTKSVLWGKSDFAHLLGALVTVESKQNKPSKKGIAGFLQKMTQISPRSAFTLLMKRGILKLKLLLNDLRN